MNRNVSVENEEFQAAVMAHMEFSASQEGGNLDIDPNAPHPVKEGQRLRMPNEQILPLTPHDIEMAQQRKNGGVPEQTTEQTVVRAGNQMLTSQTAVDISTIITSLQQQYGVETVKFGHDVLTGHTTLVLKL